MKRFFVILASLFALAAVSCTKDGGDKEPTDAEGYVVLTDAEAQSYGDYYGSGACDILANFTKGEVDEDGYFVGAATQVTIDFMSPIAEPPTIPAGDFTCAETYKQYTFFPGQTCTVQEMLEYYVELYAAFGVEVTVEELLEEYGYTKDDLTKYVYSGEGACITRQYEDESVEEFLVTAGVASVEIASDGTYTVRMDLVSDSKVFKYKYIGTITVTEDEDEGDDDDSDSDGPTGDVVLNDLSVCSVVNYGDFYTDKADDWYLEIENDEGKGVCLDLFGTTGGSTLPTGTFKIASTCAVGTALAGYVDSENYVKGCWYYEGDSCYYAADSGSVTVTKSGSNYKITFDLTDSESNAKFSGTYSGAVTYYSPSAYRTLSLKTTTKAPLKRLEKKARK